MSDLTTKTCVPCRGDVPALKGDQIAPLLSQLSDWLVSEEHHLSKSYAFPDFVTALAFVNKIGDLAEEQGHHPDIHLTWGNVGIEIWTHKIDGLTESDFILAAKIDELSR
jgi:4a-hydroxytetrahydrobiopterin dehydratase